MDRIATALSKIVGLVRLLSVAWLALPAGASAAEPIKIGAVLPFSGGLELFGSQAKLGLDLAASRDQRRRRHPRTADRDHL